MKKLSFTTLMKAMTFLLLFNAAFINAQTFEWAHGIGAQYDDIATSTITDSDGNVYVVGTFKETVDFDPSGTDLSIASKGGADIFIQKLDPNGNLIWAKTIGGAQNDEINDICLDANNNVYLIGSFKKSVDFDPGPGTMTQQAQGTYDIFIEKLDSNGDFVWMKTLGSSSIEQGAAIATDPAGNVYITGLFRKVMDFDFGTGTHTMTPVGAKDVFIEKMNTNGDFQWAIQVGGSLDEYASEIDVDANGNVYTIGTFKTTVDFDPGAGDVSITSRGQSDIFIQKLNTNGEFVWVNTIEGTANNIGKSVKVDNQGNVYTVGLFAGMVDFDPSANAHDITATGQVDGFIQKINSNGDFLWAKKVGGVQDDVINDIFVDATNNIYVAGSFTDVFNIDPNTTLTSIGSTDIFYAKYDNDGNFIVSNSYGGGLNDEATKIFVDDASNIYTVGTFNNVNVDFDPTIGFNQITNNGLKDGFIQKLNYCVAADLPAVNASSVTVCEGQSVNLSVIAGQLNSATQWKWNVGACNGTAVGEGTSITVTPTATTTYYVGGVGGCISQPLCQVVSVTVNSSSNVKVQNETCRGTEYTFADGTTMTIEEATTHTSAFTTVGGCDSIITNTVTPVEINTSVEQTGNTLTATQTEATFQWVDCATQQFIEGATDASFTPEVSGNYAVQITKNGCSETTECVALTIVATNEPVWKKEVRIHPNPFTTDLFVDFGSMTSGIVSLVNITGKTIYTQEVTNAQKLSMNGSELKSGVYFLQIIKEGTIATFKLVK